MAKSSDEDKIPTSKIDRASRFFKTGVQVGGNYMKHYGKKALFQQTDRAALDEANAKDILASFSQLRGTALKVAQMLSMDNINFSESFTGIMSGAQYSVPPMSAPLAVQAFKKSTGQNPEQVFDKFDVKAHKAASMGQVHKAEKDGIKMAVKIQYPGVADSIKSDLAMVKRAAPTLLNAPASEIAPYFDEVQDRLMEEADYTIELQNALDFSEACKDLDGIVFPEYYPDLSSKRVLTMQWIDGKHLKEFLADNPSEEVKQLAAKRLWDFYEFQVHKLRRINADPHPGNFLFRPDGSIGILDFGCTKTLSDKLYNDYFALAEPHLFDEGNKEKALEVMLQNELLRSDDTPAKTDKIYKLFGELISLVSKPYHDGEFDFTDPSFFDRINVVGKEISMMREIRGSKDVLFLNRTYFGLYSLFQSLGAKLDTTSQYGDFLREEVKAKKKKAAPKKKTAKKKDDTAE